MRFIYGGAHAAAGGNAPRRGTAYHEPIRLSTHKPWAVVQFVNWSQLIHSVNLSVRPQGCSGEQLHCLNPAIAIPCLRVRFAIAGGVDDVAVDGLHWCLSVVRILP